MDNLLLYHFIKRIFDAAVALIFLVLLFPVFVLIGLMIKIDSAGPVFYLQRRVGKNHSEFKMFKFRTMEIDADQKGLLTVGKDDKRITQAGEFLRRYKLDELPQLINVLIGNMSLVGPRPEVPRYVHLYTAEQLRVLKVKPGITDPVSIQFFDENEIIARYSNPEEGYIKEVMPEKLRMNLEYLDHRSFFGDLQIIFKTLGRIFSKLSNNRKAL